MILKSGVGVSPQKVGVGVSPWMTNHFDKGRFFLDLENLSHGAGVSPRKAGVRVSLKVAYLTLL